MDQRGAGDLFGERQAGHVRTNGTELYQHLLASDMAELRGEMPVPPPPELRVGLIGRMPASYVPEPNLRLGLYSRMARLMHLAELMDFELDAGPQGAALTPCCAVDADDLAKRLQGRLKSGRILLSMSERSPLARVEQLIGSLSAM